MTRLPVTGPCDCVIYCARRRLEHGIVELCAFKHYIKILHYLLKLDHADLPVWKRLVDMLRRRIDADTLAGSETISIMLKCRGKQLVSDYWQPLFDCQFVEVVTSMLASDICHDSKVSFTPFNGS